MRREFFAIGTHHHVLNRGGRGMDIVRDDKDRWDFIRLLFYHNDTYYNKNWERDLSHSSSAIFERPDHWPERDPLVDIVAYCLHDNHFHLLVREIKENGISRFMQRLPNAMTKRFNKKYGGTGSIFQGSYQSRLIESDADLHNTCLYITVKNVFERFPAGGLSGAKANFEKAWQWALADSFSSFADYAGTRESPLVEKGALEDRYRNTNEFKKEAKEFASFWQDKKKELLDKLELN